MTSKMSRTITIPETIGPALYPGHTFTGHPDSTLCSGPDLIEEVKAITTTIDETVTALKKADDVFCLVINKFSKILDRNAKSVEAVVGNKVSYSCSELDNLRNQVQILREARHMIASFRPKGE